jgi:hypothetical protein
VPSQFWSVLPPFSGSDDEMNPPPPSSPPSIHLEEVSSPVDVSMVAWGSLKTLGGANTSPSEPRRAEEAAAVVPMSVDIERQAKNFILIIYFVFVRRYFCDIFIYPKEYMVPIK